MAAVSVTFDGVRVDDGEATTNWTNAGSNPTLEPDYRYQGNNCISCQVKTAQVGFYFRNATVSHDMASLQRVWLAKAIQTNKDSLDGLGLVLELGTGARTAYYRYYTYTATTYPIQGGFFIAPIDPNKTEFYNVTVGGGATLTTVDMFGVQSDCAATAKAPNLGMDAIDLIASGDGLSLVGGDGATTDATFLDYVSTDEGTTNNRWGIVATREGILYVNGTLSIGSGSAAFGFTDSNRVLVFPDGRFDTGFQGIKFKMTHVDSTGSISSCVFNGRGALSSSTTDTRPNYTVTGSKGKFGISGTLFNTFKNFTANSNIELSACTFLSGASVFQSGSIISECIFSSATATVGVPFLYSDDPSLVTNNQFSFSAGHAIQFMTAGTYTFDGNTFSGYGATASTTAAVYNNTSGTITLNITPGSESPTYRNGTSATTTIVNTVTLDVHVEDSDGVAVEGAKVYVQKATPTLFTAGAGNTAGNGALVVTQTIDSDIPQTGWVTVNDISEAGGVSGAGVQSYRYVSHDAANTFTFGTTITFACTGGGTGTSLQDTVNSFVTNLREGDTVRNTTDGSWAVVTSIDSASQVTTTPLRGGADNTWTSGDFYAINDLATTLVSGTDLVDVPIILDLTNASGDISKSFPFVAPRAVIIRVRFVDGTTKYIPVRTASTITSTGMSVSVVIQEDTVFI